MKRLAVLAMLTIGAACGGDGGGSSTRPSATITSISVTSSGATLLLGSTETFTATATRSDGSTQSVTGGAWGTDAPGVATATNTGAVTGVGSGEVTVFVDASGVRGTKRIRVLPNYQGNWIGSYVITSCSQTGQMASADACGTSLGVNSVLPLTFQFTQDGTTLSGRTALGQILSDSFSAPIEVSGRASILVQARSGTFTITQAWALSISAPGRIEGEVEVVFRDAVLTGSITLRARLINTNLQATAVMPAGVSGWGLEDLKRVIR